MKVSDNIGLTHYAPARAYNGYTLFTPMSSKTVRLIDMQGRFVHSWDTGWEPGAHGYLLANGNLLYAGRPADSPFGADFNGAGGVIVEYDWDGKEVWRYEDPFMHHDFHRLDNGNTMVLRWDAVPDDMAKKIGGGLPGTERKGVMWAESLHEVDSSGTVVWEWYICDHLKAENYMICPLCARHEWLHSNAIDVFPNGDILLSCHTINRLFIIDRASGDIKWEWGKDQLAHQHDSSILDNGNILVFDNGLHRKNNLVSVSRVLEIDTDSGEIVWEFMESNPAMFYGAFISGAQRLPNGNTLVCEGPKGRFFEITKEKEVVWEYVNPLFGTNSNFPERGSHNMVFRAHRYGPDYPGLKGRELNYRKYDSINGLYSQYLGK